MAESLGLEALPPSPDPSSRPPSDLARFAARYQYDYVGFTELLEVLPRVGGPRVPFVLNEIQRAYVAARSPRDVVLKARQVGMTTEALSRDLWKFLTHAGAHVVIVVQSITGHDAQVQVAEKLGIFFDALRDRGLELVFSKKTQSEWYLAGSDASLRIIEAGASRAAANKKGRAGSVTRLHCTELAFWEYGGETLNALLECVAGPEHGTEIEYESTANGAAGEERGSPKAATGAATFYWEVQDAQRGKSGFKFHFFEWFRDSTSAIALEEGERVAPETPRERELVAKGVTPEQLKWYRRKLSEKKSQELVDQEYPSDPDTCFLLTGRSFFDGLRVAEMIAGARDPIEVRDVRVRGARGQIVGNVEIAAMRIWHRPQPGCSYVVPLDPSEGIGADAGAGVVLERGTGRHMATIWGQFKPLELARIAVGVAQYYGNAIIAPERNNHGHAVIQALQAIHKYPYVFHDHDEKPGWLSTEASRTPALDRFEQAVREGHFTTLDRFLLAEMRTFITNKNGRAEGARGSNDDLVLATAIGWYVICLPVTRYNLQNLPPG